MTEKHKIRRIPYYKDTVSIRDLDSMFEFELTNHISYLFQRAGFTVEKEVYVNDFRYDIVAVRHKEKYFVEITRDVLTPFDHIRERKEQANGNLILVTTMRVSDDDINHAKKFGIIVIDRELLREVISSKRKILKIIGNKTKV